MLCQSNGCPRITTVMDTKDLSTTPVEELIGILETHDIWDMRIWGTHVPATVPKHSLQDKWNQKRLYLNQSIFKFVPAARLLSLMTQKFLILRLYCCCSRKFYKNTRGFRSSRGKDSSTEGRRCYRCNSKEHLVSDCPKPGPDQKNKESGKSSRHSVSIDKKKKFTQRAAYAWDAESNSGSDSNEDQRQERGLMAITSEDFEEQSTGDSSEEVSETELKISETSQGRRRLKC